MYQDVKSIYSNYSPTCDVDVLNSALPDFAKIIMTKLMGAFLQNLYGWKANRK